MTKSHVDHRYQQAEDAFRRVNDRLFNSGLTTATRATMRAKADQMSRITRRCQRLALGANA